MGEYAGAAILAVLVVVYLVLKYLTRNATGHLYPPPKIATRRSPQASTFSISDLRKHNGLNGAKSYIGLNGNVYDVTGIPLYAVGGSYSVFVGHDATVALAKMSADGSHLDEQAGSLTDNEKKVMRDWETRYREKYQVVGQLVSSKKDE